MKTHKKPSRAPKRPKLTAARLADIIEDRARECGKLSARHGDTESSCFFIVGIAFSELAKSIRDKCL
jgi:hypothetical protein